MKPLLKHIPITIFKEIILHASKDIYMYKEYVVTLQGHVRNIKFLHHFSLY